jgi:hypothetical protein
MSLDNKIYFEHNVNDKISSDISLPISHVLFNYTGDTKMNVITKSGVITIDLQMLIYIALFCENRKIPLSVVSKLLTVLYENSDDKLSISNLNNIINNVHDRMKEYKKEIDSYIELIGEMNKEIDSYTDTISWYEQHGLSIDNNDF